ncbi:type III effector protein [Streptomyces sp. TRM S81-3]|uniref:Type III effector protein n=1 Tax=Streptomyces griseicoloratus TaxID=2752516 RepID=A0A926L8D5_9ACTN|nr:type III effector protein [Streptomyces griseicoloratus]MBD0424532.1 type III effector protein [Streptomyces griseicoloratus]
MTADQQESGSRPASFFAARAALTAIEDAVRTAQAPQSGQQPGTQAGAEVGSEDALAALLLLRRLRDQLAGWESGLIETAREAGASWADLAHPLGVASRQAAERRYLRLRPGPPGTTGEQRVRATRDRRAADRAVTSWARGNAADLRRLAGEISALADLPSGPRASLVRALGSDDAAHLIGPLTDARDHLTAAHSDLADRVDTLTRHTDRLRRTGPSGNRRESGH